MTYLDKISNWEQEYLKKMRNKLSDRQIKLLEGASIKSNEGMLYGGMYADWKKTFYGETNEDS